MIDYFFLLICDSFHFHHQESSYLYEKYFRIFMRVQVSIWGSSEVPNYDWKKNIKNDNYDILDTTSPN